MSNTVKLSGRLLADKDFNGLDAQASRLIEHPDEILVAVVWLDTQKVVIDTDSGASVPTARIRRIEPIGNTTDDVPAAVIDVVQDAIRKRTGRPAQPFNIGSVDEKVDPAQPELGDE